MNIPFKRALLSSLALPFAIGGQTASADLITSWDYEANSYFSTWSKTSGTGDISAFDGDGNPTTEANNDAHKLSWGVPVDPDDSPSSISITDKSGSVATDAWEDGGVFTHNNFTIESSGADLDDFNLVSALTLTPMLPPPPGSEIPLAPLTFESFFIETENVTGDCIPESDSTCDDIFTIGNTDDLGFNENLRFVSPSFIIDDYSYQVFLELVDLDFLSPAACSEAVGDETGTTTGCVGLITQEGLENTFNTRFKIVATQIPVPEPGTLALLGMGLAGLGLSRRKKAKA